MATLSSFFAVLLMKNFGVTLKMGVGIKPSQFGSGVGKWKGWLPLRKKNSKQQHHFITDIDMKINVVGNQLPPHFDTLLQKVA